MYIVRLPMIVSIKAEPLDQRDTKLPMENYRYFKVEARFKRSSNQFLPIELEPGAKAGGNFLVRFVNHISMRSCQPV